MMRVDRPNKEPYLFLTLGPKGKQVLRDEAKRMGLSLRHYCHWAAGNPNHLEKLLEPYQYEHGGPMKSRVGG